MEDTTPTGGRPGAADTGSLGGPDVDVARRVLASIDLTDLADDRSGDGIDRLCARAARHGTAAVCVWPEHVARCAELLAESPVRVATVVNFPSGDEAPADVVALTRAALAAGADEIDVVIPYRSFRAGDPTPTEQLLAAVRAVVEPPHLLKVILETGELVDSSVVAAATRSAVEQGADFVKTSTGKVATGATPAAARTMLETVRETAGDRPVGLKPSGGIRTVGEAGEYLDLADEIMGAGWARPSTFRIGASSLLDDVVRVLGADDVDDVDDGDDADAPATRGDASY